MDRIRGYEHGHCERNRPHARPQTEQQTDPTEKFGPHGEVPRELCRQHVEGKWKGVEGTVKPVFAVHLFASGSDHHRRKNQPDKQCRCTVEVGECTQKTGPA